MPDPRFGERVTAVVQLEPDARASDDELTQHVAETLARYKAPRTIVRADLVPRGPNSKPDLPATKALLVVATA